MLGAGTSVRAGDNLMFLMNSKKTTIFGLLRVGRGSNTYQTRVLTAADAFICSIDDCGCRTFRSMHFGRTSTTIDTEIIFFHW